MGKKEVQSLIIWRNKIKQKLNKKNNKRNKAKTEEEDGDNENAQTYEERKMEELEGEIRQIAKQKKKKLESEMKKREKTSIKSKLSFINQTENQESNNDGVDFDANFFNYLQSNDVDIEELPENEDVEESDQEEEPIVDEIELSDLSEEDYIDKMNEDVENNIEEWRELQNDKKLKSNKPAKKNKTKKEKKIEYDSGNEADDGEGEVEDDNMDIDNENNSIGCNDDKISDGKAEEDEEDFFENPLKKINQRNEKITNSKEDKLEKNKQKADMDEGNIYFLLNYKFNHFRRYIEQRYRR